MIIRKYFNILVGFSVLLVVSLQVVAWFMPASPVRIDRPLAEIIPSEIEGLKFNTLPLAGSRAAEVLAESDLRYDDVFYGEYKNNEFEVRLYVSYWKPGKTPYDLAGYHSPDVCWLKLGWTCEERQYATEKKLGDISLKPVEFGIYSLNGTRTEVLFWHLIGGKPNRYKFAIYDKSMTARFDRMLNMFRDARTIGIGRPSEQLFIRISSDIPFDELWTKPDFQRLLLSLKSLGIFQEEAS